jgi:hypothetical protein
MSMHGRSDCTRWQFGSITQKVLAAALCPVIVIPSAIPEPLPPQLTKASAAEAALSVVFGKPSESVTRS